MIEKEIKSLHFADKYLGHLSVDKRMKKLGEEIVELAMAIQEGKKPHINEELEDCIFILLHIAKKYNPKKPLDEYVFRAASKLIARRNERNPKQLKADLAFLHETSKKKRKA